MRRFAIAALALTLLTGCWGAETNLFGPGDWVQPEGLEGRFVSEDAAGEAQGTVDLVRRQDGLIDGTAMRKDEDKPRTSPVGFVAIPGGSGRYFLMVNRAPEGSTGKQGGEFYLIGRWKDERLEAFWPQCAGTPDMAAMKRDKIEFVNEAVCTFASKQAVLNAALLAERELETKRMFEPQLLGRLKRPDESPAPEPAPEPET
jgi:hypothetical protein